MRKGKKKMKENTKKGKGQLLFVDGCQSYNFNYLDNFYIKQYKFNPRFPFQNGRTKKKSQRGLYLKRDYRTTYRKGFLRKQFKNIYENRLTSRFCKQLDRVI